MTTKVTEMPEQYTIDIHSTVVNMEYMLIPLYICMGVIVVSYINRTGDNILEMLSEACIGAKGQGIAYVFLVFTWPVWAFIRMQSTFRKLFMLRKAKNE